MTRDMIVWAMTDIADDLIREAKEAPTIQTKKSSRPLRMALIAAAVVVLLAGAVLAVYHYTRIAERLESDWNENAEGAMTQEQKDFVEARSADLGESVTDQGITVTIDSVTCTKDSATILYTVMLDPDIYDVDKIVGASDALSQIRVENESYGAVKKSTGGGEGLSMENGTQIRTQTCHFKDLPKDAVINDGKTTIFIEMNTFWIYAERGYGEDGKFPDVTGSWSFAFTLPASGAVTEKSASEIVHFTEILDLEIYNISVDEAAINFCIAPAQRTEEPNYRFSDTGEMDDFPDMTTFTAVAYLSDGTAIPTNETSGSYDGVEEWCHIHFVAPVDPAEIVAVVFSDGIEEIKVPLE